MKKNQKNKKNSKKTYLNLVALSLIGSVVIAVAVSAVLITERKMTSKNRSEITAFQSANSGVEWVMNKLSNAKTTATIASVFGTPNEKGEVICPEELFTDNIGGCTIILLKSGIGSDSVVMNNEDGNKSVKSIISVQSTGHYQSGQKQVSRSLEAYAMPNCSGGEVRVADFCVEESLRSDAGWGDAVEKCAGDGKRLCTAAELSAVATRILTLTTPIGSDSDGEWAADATDTGEFAIVNDDKGDGDSVSTEGDSGSLDYRCCRNR